MKIILNKDHAPLGEEGDVKDVARGYARNFLFPRNIALPYNERTIKIFEERHEEIEARKMDKRKDAAGLIEKLQSLSIEISMPAGPNGKLYGAVTSQTIADELAKQGHHIERKRIELPGTHFKSVGKYKVQVRLYENASADISITVIGQELKSETKSAPAKTPRKRREFQRGEGGHSAGLNEAAPAVSPEPDTAAAAAGAPAPEAAVSVPAPEAAAPESASVNPASEASSTGEASPEV